MKCRVAMILLLISFASRASAHFVYILPAATQPEVHVVFSDLLEADKKVSIEKIRATQLFAVDAAGKRLPLKLNQRDHSLQAVLPQPRPQVVSGVTEYGVANSRHTGNRPILLKYYPKALLTSHTAQQPPSGDPAPLEIVTAVENNQIQFTALRHGKPLAEATCVVLQPDGTKTEQLKTDAQGRVPGRFATAGRYGVRVKAIDEAPGEHAGQKYDKVHHYATLVVDHVASQP